MIKREEFLAAANEPPRPQQLILSAGFIRKEWRFLVENGFATKEELEKELGETLEKGE